MEGVWRTLPVCTWLIEPSTGVRDADVCTWIFDIFPHRLILPVASYLRHAVELHSASAADSAGSVFAERVGVKWLRSPRQQHGVLKKKKRF